MCEALLKRWSRKMTVKNRMITANPFSMVIFVFYRVCFFDH